MSTFIDASGNELPIPAAATVTAAAARAGPAGPARPAVRTRALCRRCDVSRGNLEPRVRGHVEGRDDAPGAAHGSRRPVNAGRSPAGIVRAAVQLYPVEAASRDEAAGHGPAVVGIEKRRAPRRRRLGTRRWVLAVGSAALASLLAGCGGGPQSAAPAAPSSQVRPRSTAVLTILSPEPGDNDLGQGHARPARARRSRHRAPNIDAPDAGSRARPPAGGRQGRVDGCTASSRMCR